MSQEKKPVEEPLCEKKIAYKLGTADLADKTLSSSTEAPTQPTKSITYYKESSSTRQRKVSITVGATGEIRFSKVGPDRKQSKPVERAVASEYEAQSVEVLPALPIPDKRVSKAGSEREPRYSTVIDPDKRISKAGSDNSKRGSRYSSIIDSDKRISKGGSESSKRGPRYSSIIELLEAEKEKAIDHRASISGKKLRFGEEEAPNKDTDINSVAKGMRLEYRACPKTCEKFLSIQEFARLFVNDVIHEALVKGKIIQRESSTRIVEGIEYKEDEDDDLSVSSLGTYVCVFEWPTIEEFTTTLGATKIIEYFSYWKFEEDWKYCVNYLKGESDAACDYHRYEAIFSIPCRQYPIPQATASVYFTFEVSRVRPKHCLVDTYYSFEGHRLVHTPGQFKLQEAWLFHIIDAKINFYKTLTF